MDEEWPLEEKLSNVAADLLSERRYEPFVRRLFAVAPRGFLNTDWRSGFADSNS